MKQKYFNINNLIKSILYSGLIIFVTVPALANNKKKALKPFFSVPPTVHYLSSENPGTYFTINFVAGKPVNFDVIIKDGFGDLIYQKHFEASNFSKTFKLVNETDDSMANLSFLIKVSDGKIYRFVTSNSTKTINEVLVTKI